VVTNENPWVRWERNFVSQLIRLRELRGMTQTDLARYLRDERSLKFHQQTIQRIESGDRPVRLDEAYCIADALNVSLDAMTALGVSSDDDWRWEVERARRECSAIGSNIVEELEDLLGQLDLLASNAVERGLDTANQELTPVEMWALEWTRRVFNACRQLVAVCDALQSVEPDWEGIEARLGLSEPSHAVADPAVTDLLSRHASTLAPLKTMTAGELDAWLANHG